MRVRYMGPCPGVEAAGGQVTSSLASWVSGATDRPRMASGVRLGAGQVPQEVGSQEPAG